MGGRPIAKTVLIFRFFSFSGVIYVFMLSHSRRLETGKFKMFLVGNYCCERTRFRAERKCEPDLIFYVRNWPPGGAGAQD